MNATTLAAVTPEEVRSSLAVPGLADSWIFLTQHTYPYEAARARGAVFRRRPGAVAALLEVLASLDDPTVARGQRGPEERGLNAPAVVLELVLHGDGGPPVLAVLSALRTHPTLACNALWALSELDGQHREQHLAALIELVRRWPDASLLVPMLRTVAGFRAPSSGPGFTERALAHAVLPWTWSDDGVGIQAACTALAIAAPEGVDGSQLGEALRTLDPHVRARLVGDLVSGDPQATDRSVCQLLDRYQAHGGGETAARLAEALGAFGPLAARAVPALFACVQAYLASPEPAGANMYNCRTAAAALGAIASPADRAVAGALRDLVHVAGAFAFEPCNTAMQALGAFVREQPALLDFMADRLARKDVDMFPVLDALDRGGIASPAIYDALVRRANDRDCPVPAREVQERLVKTLAVLLRNDGNASPARDRAVNALELIADDHRCANVRLAAHEALEHVVLTR